MCINEQRMWFKNTLRNEFGIFFLKSRRIFELLKVSNSKFFSFLKQIGKF